MNERVAIQERVGCLVREATPEERFRYMTEWLRRGSAHFVSLEQQMRFQEQLGRLDPWAYEILLDIVQTAESRGRNER